VSGAVFRAMLLGLLRDRGALITSFILPVVFFIVFASILSTVSGEDVRVRVALSADRGMPAVMKFIALLEKEEQLQLVGGDDLDPEAVRRMVQAGEADAGVALDTAAMVRLGSGKPVLRIFADPALAVAATMVTGIAGRALASQINPGAAAIFSRTELVVREDVIGSGSDTSRAAYYAGAIAVMFLLFTTVHGAISLLEEGETGILDRVLAGPGGTRALVDGKFLYLTAQGCVQVSVIFLVAWLGYGVDVPGHFLPWALTTLAASATAAGLALVLCTACATKRQAQTISNVVILLLSALGGSMVPRFLMSPFLQDLGWITPNTWAIEAYTQIFWRQAPVEELLLSWATLVFAAVASLLVARRLAQRLQYL